MSITIKYRCLTDGCHRQVFSAIDQIKPTVACPICGAVSRPEPDLKRQVQEWQFTHQDAGHRPELNLLPVHVAELKRSR